MFMVMCVYEATDHTSNYSPTVFVVVAELSVFTCTIPH